MKQFPGFFIQKKPSRLNWAFFITKSATMAYPNDDRSIWKVDILPTDTISGMLSGTLTEGSKVTQIPLQGRLMVSSGDGSDTFC